MGKLSAQRQLPDNEAKAVGRMIRTSPQKLNPVSYTHLTLPTIE